MATVYLPSGGLGPHAAAHAGTYGTPSIAGGVAAFDWSAVPYNASGPCGWVTSGGYDELDGNSYEYNIAIPNRGGRVSFTITTANVGNRESIRFNFTIGDLQWRIEERGPEFAGGGGVTRQFMTSVNTGDQAFVPYPWTGSCTYLLWFPSGIDQPARLDFDGGSIWMRMENGFGSRYVNIAPSWESGNASTTGPPAPFPPFPPNDPKTAQCFVSDIFIEAWDPTGGLPLDYTWAVAMEDGWHGTENLAAGVGPTGADWSMTYPVRLG